MRKIDLSGMVFGKLRAIRESAVKTSGKVHWECECECGSSVSVSAGSLRGGVSMSCGCRTVEANIKRSIHGMTDTPEHKAWRQMLSRCGSESNPAYGDYGGRGISVCERWRSSFENFLSDMGYRPTKKHSIERKNTNGHYEPSNCHWATRLEQSQNTRVSRIWVVEGLEFPSSSSAANYFKVNQSTIFRWCRGYRSGDRTIPAKSSCSSFLKYEGSQ